MKKIFLSYAHKDQTKANRLYRDLHRPDSLYVWFDKKDLLPGLRWRPAIRKAIRESDFFVALLSQNAVSSRGFRHTEIREAVDIMKEFPDDQVFLIPTRLNKCEMPHDLLREIHYADLFPHWKDGVTRLCQSFGIQQYRKRRAVKRKAKAKRGVGKYKVKAGRGVSILKKPKKKSGLLYKVGLVDIDAKIGELTAIAGGLNKVQAVTRFDTFKLPAPRKALETIENNSHLNVDGISRNFYKRISPLEMDFAFCLTNRYLTFKEDGLYKWNFLGADSPVDERVVFTSMKGHAGYAQEANVSIPVAIAFAITSEFVNFFLDVPYHKQTRSCPMDFTENHDDLVKGLKKGSFCAPCIQRLNKNKTMKQAALAMLAWGRKK